MKGNLPAPKLRSYGAVQVKHIVKAAVEEALARAAQPAGPVRPHKMVLSEYLCLQRRKAGLTLKEVSRRSYRLTASNLSNLENGSRTRLLLTTAMQIAAVYHVPLEELLEAAENSEFRK